MSIYNNEIILDSIEQIHESNIQLSLEQFDNLCQMIRLYDSIGTESIKENIKRMIEKIILVLKKIIHRIRQFFKRMIVRYKRRSYRRFGKIDDNLKTTQRIHSDFEKNVTLSEFGVTNDNMLSGCAIYLALLTSQSSTNNLIYFSNVYKKYNTYVKSNYEDSVIKSFISSCHIPIDQLWSYGTSKMSESVIAALLKHYDRFFYTGLKITKKLEIALDDILENLPDKLTLGSETYTGANIVTPLGDMRVALANFYRLSSALTGIIGVSYWRKH